MDIVFRLQSVKETGVSKAQLIAAHTSGLSGVDCPDCGIWSCTGVMYPSIELSQVKHLGIPTKEGPMLLQDYLRIASRLSSVLGPERPVCPGMNLGPLEGYLEGEIEDFIWVNPWTPTMRESLVADAANEGIHLRGAWVELEEQGEFSEQLFELEAWSKARVPPGTTPNPCTLCGRIGATVPETLVLSQKSCDSRIPIQRGVFWKSSG